jgi:hypothetical protein
MIENKIKYRYLNQDELEHLEEEFKQFLIVNHVYHEEWVKINQENSEKALGLVALFSNQVLQRVYEKLKFLEVRQKSFCDLYNFDVNEISLIRMEAKNSELLDFSSVEGIDEALKNHFSEINFYQSHKKYQTNRELEIHVLLEKGVFPSTQEFWDLLQKIIV